MGGSTAGTNFFSVIQPHNTNSNGQTFLNGNLFSTSFILGQWAIYSTPPAVKFYFTGSLLSNSNSILSPFLVNSNLIRKSEILEATQGYASTVHLLSGSI